VHHQIEALQQQVASLRSAVTSPAQGQGVLLKMLGALQVSLQAFHVAEGKRHQQHDELVVVHQQAPVREAYEAARSRGRRRALRDLLPHQVPRRQGRGY
jgi:hypothetical protein